MWYILLAVKSLPSVLGLLAFIKRFFFPQRIVCVQKKRGVGTSGRCWIILVYCKYWAWASSTQIALLSRALRWSACTPEASGHHSVCWPSPAGLTGSPERKFDVKIEEMQKECSAKAKQAFFLRPTKKTKKFFNQLLSATPSPVAIDSIEYWRQSCKYHSQFGYFKCKVSTGSDHYRWEKMTTDLNMEERDISIGCELRCVFYVGWTTRITSSMLTQFSHWIRTLATRRWTGKAQVALDNGGIRPLTFHYRYCSLPRLCETARCPRQFPPKA